MTMFGGRKKGAVGALGSLLPHKVAEMAAKSGVSLSLSQRGQPVRLSGIIVKNAA